MPRVVRLFIVALALGSAPGVAGRSARASITTSGDVTGGGTPYNGTDNPWATSSLIVGNAAQGSMAISGGYVVDNNGSTSIIAYQAAASTSTVTVDGAGSTWIDGDLEFPIFGAGTLTITGGGTVLGSRTWICLSPSSNGTVTVGGGTGSSTWTNSGFLNLGFGGGTGILTITGGGTVSDTEASIGFNSSNFAVTVGGGTGASTWTNSGALYVGRGGGGGETATLTITGGGTVSNTVGYLGYSFFSNGTVMVGGGTGTSTWTNTSALYVGNFGNGTVTITGGGTVLDTQGYIGTTSGINGTVTVGGGTGISTWTNSSALSVGVAGTATVNINAGGLVNATALDGGNATSSINFDGGTLSITGTDSASNTINLLAGGGTFDVPTAGTTFTVTSAMSGTGGLTKTGQATLALTGANSYSGNTTVSVGTLTITGGGTVSNTTGFIGDTPGSNGTVTVGGGTGISTWTNSGTLSVGQYGTGTLTITGGGIVSNTTGFVGEQSGSNGTVTVGGGTGTSTWSNADNLEVGYFGTGTLTITGGGSVSNSNGRGVIGNAAGSIGMVTVGGGTGTSTWTNASELYVGETGTGTLTITGGGTVSNTVAYVGFDPSSNGTVTVGGGTGISTWTNSSSLTVGQVGTGTLNINTGGLVSATALDGGNATSSVNFDGGTLRITNTDSAANTINLLAGGGTFDIPTASTTFTITSAISGAGGLIKTGGATLALTAANSYSGNTTVSCGTLILSGSGSIALSPAISVASGATLDVSGITGGANYDGTRFSLVSGQTLKGNGTIVGAVGVASGGTLSPGNSPGRLTLGSLVLNNGSQTIIELGGTAAGTQYDQLIVGGVATLRGTLQVSTIGDYVPEEGDLFQILNAGSISGAFTTLNLPALSGSLIWDTSNLTTTGTLSVVLPGDFNGNGTVDAADYVAWRKSPDGIYTANDYNTWHHRFGQTAGSGSGASVNSAVPEPAIAMMLILATAIVSLWRRRNS